MPRKKSIPVTEIPVTDNVVVTTQALLLNPNCPAALNSFSKAILESSRVKGIAQHVIVKNGLTSTNRDEFVADLAYKLGTHIGKKIKHTDKIFSYIYKTACFLARDHIKYNSRNLAPLVLSSSFENEETFQEFFLKSENPTEGYILDIDQSAAKSKMTRKLSADPPPRESKLPAPAKKKTVAVKNKSVRKEKSRAIIVGGLSIKEIGIKSPSQIIVGGINIKEVKTPAKGKKKGKVLSHKQVLFQRLIDEMGTPHILASKMLDITMGRFNSYHYRPGAIIPDLVMERLTDLHRTHIALFEKYKNMSKNEVICLWANDLARIKGSPLTEKEMLRVLGITTPVTLERWAKDGTSADSSFLNRYYFRFDKAFRRLTAKYRR